MLLLAGSGSRFESRIPKQFLNLTNTEDNVPLFIQSVIALSKFVFIDHLILVVSKEYIESTEFLEPLNTYKKSISSMRIDIAEGGKTRHESFLKGADLVSHHENSSLMIHDANRPFISESFGLSISEQLNTLSNQRACLIPVIPTIDSLCKVSLEGENWGQIINYIPRENTYRIQTPQLIFSPILEEALAKAKMYSTGTEYTDEGSFMSSMGFKVFTFAGDPANIKITTKNDLL